MENIEFRKGAIDASACIGEGWNFIKPNYGLFVGMVVVELLLVVAASLIPYAGEIINTIVGGALACGIYIALLAQRRKENVPFSLMFEGFSRVVPTTLVQLISAVPLAMFALAASSFIPMPPPLAPDGGNIAEVQAAIFNRDFLLPLLTGGSVVFIVSIIFNLLLFFALPLIAERDAKIGEALKLSAAAGLNNIGGLIVLFIFEGLLAIAGALACGVGIIFVLPVIYAANIAAYKRVFPDENPQSNGEPPRPEDYSGGTYGTPQQ
jgi:hypothetical protein